jgi:hypothetical protein
MTDATYDKPLSKWTDGELAEELCRSLLDDAPINIFAIEYRRQIRAEIKRRPSTGQQSHNTEDEMNPRTKMIPMLLLIGAAISLAVLVSSLLKLLVKL